MTKWCLLHVGTLQLNEAKMTAFARVRLDS